MNKLIEQLADRCIAFCVLLQDLRHSELEVLLRDVLTAFPQRIHAYDGME